MIVLVYCAQVHNSATYQDVVFACCGHRTRNFCSLAIAVYSFGTCITFLIIIGDQWDKCKISDDVIIVYFSSLINSYKACNVILCYELEAHYVALFIGRWSYRQAALLIY